MSDQPRLRKDTSVYLVGHYTPQIIGNKLPSVRQVLSVLFFNIREVKLSVKESSLLVTKELIIFWEKARIPTQAQQNCVKKVEKLYAQWRGLQKNAKKTSTTNSNLGRLNGASTLLEQALERDMMYLPCRHHIFELILKSVFDEKMPTSSDPTVPLFKRFRDSWNSINKFNFKPGMEEINIRHILQPIQEEILIFVNNTLQLKQPRDDYKELLQLTICFIRKPENHTFRAPGAFHHARWMAKAIYCLKIFLFREQFKLTSHEINNISDICIFIVTTYIQAWFTAPVARKAPHHDLTFLQKLLKYQEIDSAISKVTVKKMINHLWYLSPQCIALSFFDEDLSTEVKNKMIEGLAKEGSDEQGQKRVILKHDELDQIIDKSISQFVSITTSDFFKRFDINTDFLKLAPVLWTENENYKSALVIVNNLKVVNDTAERGIKLITDYNNILTKNEEQKQFVLQIVTDYRKQYPDCKKKTLTTK